MRPIDSRWFGVLTSENIDQVAEVIRRMLAGRFSIMEGMYQDSGRAQLRVVSGDCRINSEWTSAPRDEPVRVFRDGDHVWMGFSAGGFFWTFNARTDGGHDHDDYRYPYFSFEGNSFVVTDRAPAGKGCLHQRGFAAHNRPDAREMLGLFAQVNRDCKASGEQLVPLTDSDYYADQIKNIFELSDYECQWLAKEMADLAAWVTMEVQP